jgi:N-methylhydantoinase A
VTGQRKVYFSGEWHQATTYDRARLPEGATVQGPAIFEQQDSTFVLDPGATAQVDDIGNLLVHVNG